MNRPLTDSELSRIQVFLIKKKVGVPEPIAKNGPRREEYFVHPEVRRLKERLINAYMGGEGAEEIGKIQLALEAAVHIHHPLETRPAAQRDGAVKEKTSGWIEIHDEKLKELVAEGLTFNAIAAKMCKEFPDHKFTRNMVLGRAARQGFTQPNSDPHRRWK
jgi:hypothetical protein